MKQIFMQKNALRAATVRSEDVPSPQCGARSVLIANRHSLISAGTESTAVGSNKRDMIVKALRDPSIRQSVVDMVVQDGMTKTAERVQFEMTKWTPLGYSGAGIAIEVGRDVSGIRPGDPVAYAGQGHAECIRVAKNLCVPIPGSVTTPEAAFVALGSIALQAVRRAEVQVGDTIAVLGLGLVGQLVSQLLRAAGARVLGTDVLRSRLDIAQKLGLEAGFHAANDVINEVVKYTNGLGVDRVMICASTDNRVVIEQAVKMARDRGRIVVVGQCSLDVPRHDFYMKELDLVISRSYGPGRYDVQYEEHGIDYPIGYVRWTEQRNMQEFLRLLQIGTVDVKPLITHQFEVNEAGQGYDLLMNNPAECLGVLLQYQESAPQTSRSLRLETRSIEPVRKSKANVAVIGCGSFARQFHLPNLMNSNQLAFHTLAASTAQSAKEMALRYGASHCTSSTEEIFQNPEVDAIMIFTRDTSHARLAARALEAGKHVLCEKPLATSHEDCELLRKAAEGTNRICMTGFNRRFAPMFVQIKQVLDGCKGPKLLHYRVNAGALPPSNWIYDAVHSAGRIVGEGCHFIDIFRWIVGAEAVRVTAVSMGKMQSWTQLEDVSATIEFADGSVATLLYTASGSTKLGKEHFEAFSGGTAIVMDDYRRLIIDGVRRLDHRQRRIDKGHNAELSHFADAVMGNSPPLITLEDGLVATELCLAILESIRTETPGQISR